MDLLAPSGLLATFLFLASCTRETAPSPEQPVTGNWKERAAVIRMPLHPDGNSTFLDDGTYLMVGEEAQGTQSVFQDLINCGIQRFEVNRVDGMHGATLQVVVPRDGLLEIARPCLQRELPPNVTIRPYDGKSDTISNEIFETSKTLDTAAGSRDEVVENPTSHERSDGAANRQPS